MDTATRPGQGKSALITGASGGIGYELARLFARDGYNLVLVARSGDKLDAIKGDLEKRHGISVTVIVKDLSEHPSPQELFDQVQNAGIKVEVLINNAGFSDFGLFVETDLQKALEMLQVNVVTLTQLTRLFLPGMVQGRSGRIMNVASTAAYFPGPLMAVYYATKAYVLSFSEALSNELEGTGVTVTALCPGPTETGFQKRGNLEDSKLVAGRKIMDARTVARIGYKGLMKGQPVVVTGLRNLLMVQSVRFTPRAIIRRTVRRAQERV